MKTRTGRAAFLDRDGTIIEDVPYNADPAHVTLIPGAAVAIRKLNSAGFVVILATNQSGIARGLFTERELDAVNERMKELLAREGAKIDAIYYCPHLPPEMLGPGQSPCSCRKPEPGLVMRAQEELGIDPAQSCFIGDRKSDVELALKTGGKPCLVRTGEGAADAAAIIGIEGIIIADDLLAAVNRILEEMDGNPETGNH